MKQQKRPQKPKSAMLPERVRFIQELRRSNAAQPHGHGEYTRKIKHPGKEWS